MKFIDTSPFPALCFQFRDTGAMRWVVVLRATFDIGPAGALTKRSPQPPLQLAEQAYGDIDATPPRRETQLAPQKPRTDLVVHATAHAPGGKPAPRFDVALRVRDAAGAVLLAHRLTVTGPRAWRRKGALARGAGAVAQLASLSLFKPEDWALGDAEPTLEVPLRYDYAYGGTVRLDDAAAAPHDPPLVVAHPDNPVGRGFVPGVDAIQEAFALGASEAAAARSAWAARAAEVPAPQIELPDRPIASIHEEYPLVGWGLVAKHWGPRHARLGTLDDAWLRDRHPLMPLDFDPRYWNGAHPDLQLERVPNDAVIELLNLVPPQRAPNQLVQIRLPGLAPTIEWRDFGRGGGATVTEPLRLDTIDVDLLDDELTLVYRASVAATPELAYIHLDLEPPA